MVGRDWDWKVLWLLLFDGFYRLLLEFPLRKFGCLGQLIVLLFLVKVLILHVFGENVRLGISVGWLFAEADWLWLVAKGMIQGLEKLSRFDSNFPLHELFIVIFLILTLLVTFIHKIRQIILELITPFIFRSLFAASLVPFVHTLAQLSHKLYFFLHPLQLLQELIHC